MRSWLSPRPAPAPAVAYTIDLAARRGHIQAPEIRVAEGAVHRQVGRNPMRFDDPAGRCEYVDERTRPAPFPSRACEDIAVAIHAHPLDAAVFAAMIAAEAVQQAVLPERVALHRVGAQLAR